MMRKRGGGVVPFPGRKGIPRARQRLRMKKNAFHDLCREGGRSLNLEGEHFCRRFLAAKGEKKKEEEFSQPSFVKEKEKKKPPREEKGKREVLP